MCCYFPLPPSHCNWWKISQTTLNKYGCYPLHGSFLVQALITLPSTARGSAPDKEEPLFLNLTTGHKSSPSPQNKGLRYLRREQISRKKSAQWQNTRFLCHAHTNSAPCLPFSPYLPPCNLLLSSFFKIQWQKSPNASQQVTGTELSGNNPDVVRELEVVHDSRED